MSKRSFFFHISGISHNLFGNINSHDILQNVKPHSPITILTNCTVYNFVWPNSKVQKFNFEFQALKIDVLISFFKWCVVAFAVLFAANEIQISLTQVMINT